MKNAFCITLNTAKEFNNLVLESVVLLFVDTNNKRRWNSIAFYYWYNVRDYFA